MNRVYAPGCALMLYKPELAKELREYLNDALGEIEEHLTCCRHEPKLEDNTQVINTCAGCDRRFRELYENISTISLWEVLAESRSFNFPDYNGLEMTIHDACPTRSEDRVHVAIRALLDKMNIKVIEPQKTRSKASCCGDNSYGIQPIEAVYQQIKKRAEEMPCQDVVVYCVSCIKAMNHGGKRPRYIVDLLFGKPTEEVIVDIAAWHKELEEFINEH